MTFDLVEMARRREEERRPNRRRDGLVLRGIEVTDAIEAELRDIIVQPVNLWGRETRESLLPLYDLEFSDEFRDVEGAQKLRDVIEATDVDAQRLVVSLSAFVERWVVRVDNWHRGRWAEKVRQATDQEVEFLIADLAGSEQIKAHQQWASGLIRNVSDDMRRRVETTTFRAVAGAIRRRELANDIAEALRIGRARARFIARDQANKLSGKMDELRHEEAGIKKYRWETARDERVRQTHRSNQGKIFAWNKPPRVTGHPRTEPNCRCTPQPFIPLVEQVDPSQTEADIDFV